MSGVTDRRRTAHQRGRFARSAETWLMAKPHRRRLWGIARPVLRRVTSATAVRATLTATRPRVEFMAPREARVHGKPRGHDRPWEFNNCNVRLKFWKRKKVSISSSCLNLWSVFRWQFSDSLPYSQKPPPGFQTIQPLMYVTYKREFQFIHVVIKCEDFWWQ